MEKTVGPYRLGDSLGSLPFGELVAATHSARSEPLALLLLDDRLAKDHRFRGLLRLEVARAGGLRHPAIARAVEVGEHSGTLYVVVERPADARTLADTLAAGDPPAREAAVATIRSLAEGLDAAHGRRLVHGALNPSTVLVGSGGSAALVGSALLGAVEEAGLGAVVAERTDAAYVAPEQQGRRAVASADGYALGVLAAALLQVQSPPIGPADAVGSVLARQCAADPGARFPTCAAFAAALAEAVAPAGEAAVEPRPAASAPSSPAHATAEPVRSVSEPPRPAAQPAEAPAPLPEPPAAPPWEVSAADTLAVPAPSPSPGAEPSLPWDAPTPSLPPTASAPPSAPGDTVRPGRPPVTPAPEYSSPDLPVAAPGGRLSSVVDPPRQTQAIRPPGPAPSDADVTTTAIDLTPAMTEVLKPEPPRDLIGEVVQFAAERVPAIDQLVDRYSRDGKIGRFPLGVVVAGGLAGLLILVGQSWPATVLIMIVVVLYGVPKLGAALTASERANPRAARVTGTARVKPAPDGVLTGSPELILANGVTLGLRDDECDVLSLLGRPVTIERPAYGTVGVVDVVIHHELPGVTVTYIAPNQILLDVRDRDGTVLYRRPPYTGEPGDRVLARADRPRPGRPDVPAASGAVPSSAPTRRAPGQPTVLPLPTAAQAALQHATTWEVRKAAAILGGGLIALGVIPQLLGGYGFFVFVVVMGIAFRSAPTLVRAFTLWSTRDATSMVRVVGPVDLMEYGSDKASQYFIHLADGIQIKTDADTYRALAYAGEVRADGRGISDFLDVDGSRPASDGYLLNQHEIPAATTTYLPGAPLLLEIVNASGETVYRDPVLKAGDLGPTSPPA